MVRTAAEMAAVLAHNRFLKMPGNESRGVFSGWKAKRRCIRDGDKPDKRTASPGSTPKCSGYYTNGQGDSKLKIPAAKNGTARNMNTIAKLAEMADGLGS